MQPKEYREASTQSRSTIEKQRHALRNLEGWHRLDWISSSSSTREFFKQSAIVRLHIGTGAGYANNLLRLHSS